MGNKLLSECRNQNMEVEGDERRGMNMVEAGGQKKEISNRRGEKDKGNGAHMLTGRQFWCQYESCDFQKPKEIQSIYTSLIKQKLIAYSIQRKQILTYYGVLTLQQLCKKVYNEQKSKRQLSQVHKSDLNRDNKYGFYQNQGIGTPDSSTFSQRSYKDRNNIDIKIIQFYLTSYQNRQNLSLSQNQKNVFRTRSLSRSIQQYNFQDTIQQKQQFQSIFDLEKINIFNRKYIYVGYLNEQGQPHGCGQLYHYKGFQQGQKSQSKYRRSLEKRDQCTKNQRIRQHKENTIISTSRQKNQQNHLSSKQQFRKQNLQLFIEGQFSNGEILSDDCIIIFKSGHYFRGGFSNNNFNGRGKLHISNHLELIGSFSQGLLNGKGKAIYPDGGSYQGIFMNGLRQGKGKMMWKSSIKQKQQQNTDLQIVYQGYFKNDRMNGLGHLKTPNYQYWGPFINNTKQGKGTIKFKDGNKFQGWFQKDQIKGYGQLHYPDGRVQKGIFPLSK